MLMWQFGNQALRSVLKNILSGSSCQNAWEAQFLDQEQR